MRECEEMLKIVQKSRDSRLDIAGGSRLTSCQNLHTCQACQKLKRHASWSTIGQKVQTGHSVTSQLELAVQSSREAKPPDSSVLKKTDSSHSILTLVYIPLIIPK